MPEVSHICRDESSRAVLELLVKRFDKYEEKIDSLSEFRVSVLASSRVISIVISAIIGVVSSGTTILIEWLLSFKGAR